MNLGFFHRGTHNQRLTQNLGWTPADYTIVNVVSPLDGAIIPVYNLDPAKRANVNRLDVNSTDSDLRERTYNGLQAGFNARVRGFQFFGGWTMDRIIDTRCDAIESNAGRYAGTAVIAANNFPQPDFHFCDQSELDLPFLHEFKLAGSYTLPWYDIQANVALQSYNGQPLFTRWNIAPTTRYAANCVGAVPTGRAGHPEPDARDVYASTWSPPASSTTNDRTSSTWASGRSSASVGISSPARSIFFNIVNSSYVKSQNITIGTSLGQPLDILQPRTMRLAAQLRF